MNTKQLSRTPEATADNANASHSLIARSGLASGNPLEVRSAEGGVQSSVERWTEVRRYFDMASKFAHATLACQVMTGFYLLELKAELGIAPGRPAKFGHDARIDDLGHDARSWEERIEAEGKISRRTANRFMEMAEALKPKLARMKGEPLLRELIKTSPADWSEDDSRKIFKVLEEVTSGKTQGEFMCEIGAAKKPAALPPAVEMSPEEALSARKANAEMIARDFSGRLRLHCIDGDVLTRIDREQRKELLGVCVDVANKIRHLNKRVRAGLARKSKGASK